MSIRGIDTQIMMARLTDSVRETSAMHKRPELAQDALAAQRRINDAEDQTKVAKTTEAEMEEIRTDVDEDGSGNGYSGESGSEPDEDEMDDEPGPDMIVPPGNYLIDIMI